MILASIGHKKFVLNSLDQATQLLAILSDAKQVESTYNPGTREHLLHADSYQSDINISVVADTKIHTEEAVREIINQSREASNA